MMRAVAAASVLALLSGGAGAQIVPPASLGLPQTGRALDDEILRRQRLLEQPEAPEGPAEPALTVPQQAHPRDIAPGGPSIILREVTHNRSDLLDESEIDAVVAPRLGRRLDLAGLQEIVVGINALYAARGMVTANAMIPPQKLQNGVLRIELVEARVDRLDVEGAREMTADYVLDRLETKQGDVLRVPDLGRAVARFNRLNETSLRAALEPGEVPGTTRVNLQITEPVRDSLSLFADNKGSPTTGGNEAGYYYRRYGLLGVDDRFSLYNARSAGNYFTLNSTYSVPLGPDLPRLAISYGRSNFRVVNGPSRVFGVDGQSQSTGLTLTQPVLVDEAWLIQAVGGVSFSTTSSRLSKVAVNDVHAWRASLGPAISYLGERFSLSLNTSLSAVRALDHLRSRSVEFVQLTGNTSNALRLPDNSVLSFNGAWQASQQSNLTSDQQFQIGGPTTVRGYAINTLSGDGGAYASLELRHGFNLDGTSLPIGQIDAFAFSDAGAIMRSPGRGGRSSLLSSGLGASWSPWSNATLELSAGFPLLRASQSQAPYQLYVGLTFRPF